MPRNATNLITCLAILEELLHFYAETIAEMSNHLLRETEKGWQYSTLCKRNWVWNCFIHVWLTALYTQIFADYMLVTYNTLFWGVYLYNITTCHIMSFMFSIERRNTERTRKQSECCLHYLEYKPLAIVLFFPSIFPFRLSGCILCILSVFRPIYWTIAQNEFKEHWNLKIKLGSLPE